MKYIYIIIVIIAIGFLGLIYYQNSTQQHSPNNTQSDNLPSENRMEPNTAEDISLQAGGNSFADPKGVFTILYPNDYVQDVEGNGQYTRIYKRGNSERPQSEMTDGVIMVFEVIDSQDQTLEEWVDSYIETLTAGGTVTITQPKQTITVNGYPGFTFKAQGLGESTYTYIQKDANSQQIVGINYSVIDPENIEYQTEVNAILDNITLLK